MARLIRQYWCCVFCGKTGWIDRPQGLAADELAQLLQTSHSEHSPTCKPTAEQRAATPAYLRVAFKPIRKKPKGWDR